MINPKYIEKLKEFCTPEEIPEGIFFGFLITYKDEIKGLENYILDGEKSVFPYLKFQRFAINLCKKNLENNRNELIIPLFSFTEDDYDTLLRLLLESHITSTGHPNNKLGFNIFSPNPREMYLRVKTRIKNFDIHKSAKVIARYYETTEYASKLDKYLEEGFIQDYNYE